ncbi:MAG: acyloxyacyl hydrolase [Lysobacterales bacterium]
MTFRSMRVALALVALLGALSAAPASAAYEIAGGYVDTIDGQETWTGHVTWLSDHRFPWEITGGYIAARDDFSPKLSPDTFYVSFAKRYVHRSGVFFAGGVVLTNTDSGDRVLSGPFQFVNGIGWQGERIVVTVRHMSNANFTGKNRGENLLTVGWRF